jgi:hypothetical protein
MDEEDRGVTLEDLFRDTAEMACRFHERTENTKARSAVIDFLPLQDGKWIARAIPFNETSISPVYVPDETGAATTIRDAVVILNRWLVIALASPSFKVPPQA